jgi:hypothetical protein
MLGALGYMRTGDANDDTSPARAQGRRDDDPRDSRWHPHDGRHLANVRPTGPGRRQLESGISGGDGRAGDRSSAPSDGVGDSADVLLIFCPEASQCQVAGISESLARAYMRGEHQSLIFCYERELETQPHLRGTVNVELVARGDITWSAVSGLDHAIESCMYEAFDHRPLHEFLDNVYDHRRDRSQLTIVRYSFEFRRVR